MKRKGSSEVNLIQCVYISRAGPTLRSEDLVTLLKAARVKNLATAISGVLLQVNDSLIQVLEGPQSQVEVLYERIVQDRRHLDVTQIFRGSISRRSFQVWTMGFASLQQSEIAEMIGQPDFFKVGGGLNLLDPGRVRLLLSAFAAGGWGTDETGSTHPVRVARRR